MGSKNAMFQTEPADELMLNQSLMAEWEQDDLLRRRLNAFGEYLENLYDGAQTGLPFFSAIS